LITSVVQLGVCDSQFLFVFITIGPAHAIGSPDGLAGKSDESDRLCFGGDRDGITVMNETRCRFPISRTPSARIAPCLEHIGEDCESARRRMGDSSGWDAHVEVLRLRNGRLAPGLHVADRPPPITLTLMPLASFTVGISLR